MAKFVMLQTSVIKATLSSTPIMSILYEFANYSLLFHPPSASHTFPTSFATASSA